MAETKLNGGQLTAKQLKLSGIDTIFGVVAGPMIELFSGAVEEGLQVIGCRHEENAAFMASAWGYVKKKPGVVCTFRERVGNHDLCRAKTKSVRFCHLSHET
ncbi:MAG: thiamine pyrophosphate-binding protein [Myxococcota bacterium]